MNRPFDKVHDIEQGYGRLIVPWFGGWIGLRLKGSKVVALDRDHKPIAPPTYAIKLFHRFHNCRATGTY
jgi:hypothetical protein